MPLLMQALIDPGFEGARGVIGGDEAGEHRAPGGGGERAGSLEHTDQ